jgi:glycosyltransferase involved in cell wall biosynthesis
MRPRRVLIVSHHGLPHVGGVEVLVDAEIRALADAGCEVTHVTSNLSGDAQTPSYPPGVRVIRVPAWHLLERRARLAYPIFHPKLCLTLVREIRRADAVHAHGFIYHSSVAALLLAKMRGKPTRLTDHGGMMPLKNPWLSALMQLAGKTLGRLTTRRADRLIAYNLRVLRELEMLAGRRDKSVFLPYPTNPVLFHPPSRAERAAARAELGWTGGKPRVLFVGRMTPDKGVLLLIEALDPSFELVLCGPGDPDILSLPRPGVTYLPPRPQPEVAKLYYAADLLALPSIPGREGFPLVVREALACGLKVVMSYEWGYEPYRRLPNLSFAELDPPALRAALLTALARTYDPAPPPRDLCPAPENWVERLYNLEKR